VKRSPGGAKLARAKIRHFIFTVAPDRLMRGMLKRRHLERPIELREITLHVPSWPEAWEGLRIAHVSDFHLGELMPVPRALELIERVTKAKPDLLACTGDVVDLEWGGAEPLLEAMGAVSAPLGQYLVLGNHDYLDDPDALVRAARRRGLTVLEDEVTRAMRHARASGRGRGGAPRDASSAPAAAGDGSPGDLLVGGVDWSRTKRELSARVASLRERPHLLLAHNPKAFQAAARMGVPLTLAGHTHGGQVGVPDRRVKAPLRGRGAAHGDASRAGLEAHSSAGAHEAHGAAAGREAPDGAAVQPINLAAPARARLRALRKGLYAQGPSRLFVNVGAGSWFPARVNCPAEIVLLTVKR